MAIFGTNIAILGRNGQKWTKISKLVKIYVVKTLLFPLKCQFLMIKYPYPYRFKNVSTDSKKYPYKCWQLHTGIPLFFLKIQYSARWVLRPPSVRGVEVAKASAAAKARVWI